LCPFKVDEIKKVLKRAMKFITVEKEKKTSKNEDLGKTKAHTRENRCTFKRIACNRKIFFFVI
jgi:hypothetical protein